MTQPQDKPAMLTDKEAAARIRSLPEDKMESDAHIEADKILCGLLAELGYSETVKAFLALDKWYE